MQPEMIKKAKISARTIAIYVVSISFLLFQIYQVVFKSMHPMILTPLHLFFSLLVILLSDHAGKKSGKKWQDWLDLPLILILFFNLFYIISQTNRLTSRVQYLSPVILLDIVNCFLILIVLLEITRRKLGWFLFGFVVFFIVYAWLGPYFPGIFRFSGTNLRYFTEILTMGSGGIYGSPLYASVNSLFYFVIFGVLFAACGGGQLLIDIAMKVANKGYGGPAKAAVVSSGLMGMISGSAAANVVTTGSITIPLMKRTGYRPHEAGAVEAAASTGGQIMPPIMGVGAFMMAELLGISYFSIAKAAIVPAIAYFFSIFCIVGGIARKRNLGSVRLDVAEANAKTHAGSDIESDAVSEKAILPRLYLLLPLVVLIYYICSGASLMKSGTLASLTVIVTNVLNYWFNNSSYQSAKKMVSILVSGVKQAADIALPTAACGVVIGLVVQSGLATKIARLISLLGADYLLVALIITMIGCMILGMALPAAAAYLIANILFASVLTGLGIAPLAANLFIFYFGIFAQITPPVCIASYTAAGIAGANMWKTGWTAVSYAVVALFVPYIFIYSPSILLVGSLDEIIYGVAVLFYGVWILAMARTGFGIRALRAWERIVLGVAAIGMIIPESFTDYIGVGIGSAMLVYIYLSTRRKGAPHSEA